jgi:hypothetical protein
MSIHILSLILLNYYNNNKYKMNEIFALALYLNG